MKARFYGGVVGWLVWLASGLAQAQCTDTNLVGWWTFDEGSGSVALDSSGLGHPGTLYNASGWSSGWLTNALHLDGINAWVAITNAAVVDAFPKTVTCWVKFRTMGRTNGAQNAVLGNAAGAGASGVGFFIASTTNQQIRFQAYDGGGVAKTFYSSRVATGIWQHVALVLDGTNLVTYVNGTRQGIGGCSGYSSSSQPWLRVGALPGGFGYADADFDDLMVWSCALRADQIQALVEEDTDGDGYSNRVEWNVGTAPHDATSHPSWDADLVGWWRLDETNGLLAADSSGQANPGNWVGGPVWSAGVVSHAAEFAAGRHIVGGRSYLYDLTNAITVVTWLKPWTAQPTGYSHFFSDSAGYYNGWCWYWFADRRVGFQMTAANGNSIYSSGPLSTGVWHQVAVTLTGGVARLYIDGTQNGTANWSGAILLNTDVLRLGAIYTNGVLPGLLDEAQVYRRALTSNEVVALYNVDTDGDGLSNVSEVNTHGTNPNLVDSDGDGMPDGWEVTHGFDPLVTEAGDYAPGADPDGDGLTNAQEATWGTDPFDSDTDDDGMPDGWEVAQGLNPLVNDASEDPDDDGLTNLQEYANDTDPQNADTDGDGLLDGEEITLGTDPLDSDTDADGMSDSWEVAHGFNPLITETGDYAPGADPDGDGLTNAQEATWGTDPFDSDTDDDGMPDGWEVSSGLNPLGDDGDYDADWDGLSNAAEFSAGTDPLNWDTDGDGMADGWEVMHGLNPLVDDTSADADSDGLSNLEEYFWFTDPQNADTDGDGLSDGAEVNTYGTNPLYHDSDGDGLSDGAEIGLGSDPLATDSDNDGMPDGWEVAHGLNPLVDDTAGDLDGDGLSNGAEFALGTDPQNSDTDADGLTDGSEVNMYGTDPAKWDTDGDGLSDGWEVAHGLDPLDPSDGFADVDGDGLTYAEELILTTDPLVVTAFLSGTISSTSSNGTTFGSVTNSHVYLYLAEGCVKHNTDANTGYNNASGRPSNNDCGYYTGAPGTAGGGFLCSGLNSYSLVGRINDANCFQLGTNGHFAAGSTGTLTAHFDDGLVFYGDNSGSLTMKLVAVAVQAVEWTVTNNVTADNPSTHGGGYRVFPEKATPGGANLNTVKARITLNAKAPVNQTVYYQIFDMDDPTANGTNNVVDPTDTATAFLGADNRLSAGGTGLGITPAGANTATVTAGTNIVDVTFTVTDPQPGNNWKLVAHIESAYVSTVNINSNSTVKGLDFLQGGSNSVPASFKSSLLSVWRTLHVEVDSMAAPGTNNTIAGLVTAVWGTGVLATNVTVNWSLDDGSANLSLGSGHGRFEKGWMKIGDGAGSPGATITTNLLGNGTNFVAKPAGGISIPCKLTQGGCTLNGNIVALSSNVFTLGSATSGTCLSVDTNYVGGTLNVTGIEWPIIAVSVAQTQVTVSGTVEIPFVLHDDDEDNRLPYANPSLTWLTTTMEDAYVKVVNDGGGDINNNKQTVPFVANVQDTTMLYDEIPSSAGAFESRSNRADNYWVVWLCSAFQSFTMPDAGYLSAGDHRADGDPNSESPLIAITTLPDHTSPAGGALLFRETFYDWGTNYYNTAASILEPHVIAHELGHTFHLPDWTAADPPENWNSIMGRFWIAEARFAPVDLNTIRKRTRSPGIP